MSAKICVQWLNTFEFAVVDTKIIGQAIKDIGSVNFLSKLKFFKTIGP